jgi:uncharacterized protein (TIGR03067 family)
MQVAQADLARRQSQLDSERAALQTEREAHVTVDATLAHERAECEQLQNALAADQLALDALRQTLQAQRGALIADRHTLEIERQQLADAQSNVAAQTRQLSAAQTAIAGQRTALDEAARQVSRQMTELDRQREQIERDRAQLAATQAAWQAEQASQAAAQKQQAERQRPQAEPTRGPVPSEADRSQRELQTIQGTWTLVAVEADGWELPQALIKQPKFVWVIEGDKITHRPEIGVKRESLFELDLSQSPNQIAFRPLNGRANGRWKHAIFALDGDSLKVCLSKDGNQLPSRFATKARDGLRILVFKRQAR